jgi:hypothetical protein
MTHVARACLVALALFVLATPRTARADASPPSKPWWQVTPDEVAAGADDRGMRAVWAVHGSEVRPESEAEARHLVAEATRILERGERRGPCGLPAVTPPGCTCHQNHVFCSCWDRCFAGCSPLTRPHLAPLPLLQFGGVLLAPAVLGFLRLRRRLLQSA